MKNQPKKLSSDLGPFRFKKIGGKFLLTNDLGDYAFVPEGDFGKLLDKGGKSGINSLKELKKKGFLKEHINESGMAERFASKHLFLKSGPSLHIVVLTLRCNHKCVYCHASAEGLQRKELDMDKKTAKAVVDTIFKSTSRSIAIEFQGGEPLLNWPVLKYIVEYAREKNKKIGKDLLITVVTNLSLMDKEKLNWLFKKRVVICTSLDGHEELHNRQRVYPQGNAYKNAAKWIKIIQGKYATIGYKIHALSTITKHSLPHWKEIVDTYAELNLPRLFLRFINPFGIAVKTSEQIAYTPDEFLDFYRKATDYIIELNLKGRDVREGFAMIILQKIFTDNNINFLDLRSPCGAGIGQLAYNFNGDVYTCDEGRMMSRMGEEAFRLGNVLKNSYEDILGHPVVKSACIASTLEGLPECCHCVFKPYCGVCPVYNYSQHGNIFHRCSSSRCETMKGIFNYLFEKLQDKKTAQVLNSWVQRTTNEDKGNA